MTGLGKHDDAQKTHMHRDIEEDELENVVKACQTNKSPGIDVGKICWKFSSVNLKRED